MTLKKNDFTLFHVFTGENAKGNPAAVQLVDQLPDSNGAISGTKPNTVQKKSNSTAVYIKPIINHVTDRCEFEIRWFNNKKSIQRCGHGTLAAAAFLKQYYAYNKFIFHSSKECLTVSIDENSYLLQLPIERLETLPNKTLSLASLRLAKTNQLDGYLIAEFDHEQAVREFQLSLATINKIKQRALIITAKSESTEFDIVFRYFAPQHGKSEDIATGSATSILWPFWDKSLANKIKTNTLYCYQASPDGGEMEIMAEEHCIFVSGRVKKASNRQS